MRTEENKGGDAWGFYDDRNYRDEVSMKRERGPGNAAAMREALVFLRDKELYMLEGNVRHCVGLTVFGLEQVCKIMRGVIEDALSAPARQCDVGTAEEQTSRLRAICNKFKPGCIGCKYVTDLQKVNCWLAWAQTPYEAEEGVNNE